MSNSQHFTDFKTVQQKSISYDNSRGELSPQANKSQQVYHTTAKKQQKALFPISYTDKRSKNVKGI